MTTIAYDGKILACDSQISGNFIHSGHECKISVVVDIMTGYNILVCPAGSVSWGLDMINFFSIEGVDYPNVDKEAEKIGEDGGECLVVHPKSTRAFLFYSDRPTGIPVSGPFAIGSGAGFAMGAMKAGKTATEAVEIAMSLDPETGGKIFYCDTSSSNLEIRND